LVLTDCGAGDGYVLEMEAVRECPRQMGAVADVAFVTRTLDVIQEDRSVTPSKLRSQRVTRMTEVIRNKVSK